MGNSIQSIRGMHDILPDQTAAWRFLERTAIDVLDRYGYREIRLPLLERTELFARSIGEVTDIVEKEMYTFEDRNGDSVTLRPEGTAGCVRAGIQHGLLHNQQQRMWYLGPMFRHERPQKGRYRQFHQIGVEAFGMTEPEIDAELIVMTARMWRALGVGDLRLEINSLGNAEARAAYRERLVAYLEAHLDSLDEDARRRLYTNPLRILDSKDPHVAEVLRDAPRLVDHLDSASQRHLDQLRALLEACQIDYTLNPQLVRGLDYYTGTVFEWMTDALGAQGTVCAGGRYDGLVEQLGGRATPAAGFAIGLERVLGLMTAVGVEPPAATPHAYLVTIGEGARSYGLQLAENLRGALPSMRLMVNSDGGSFKSQMRRADRSGAAVALILGESELKRDTITVKFLRDAAGRQEPVLQRDLAGYLQPLLNP